MKKIIRDPLHDLIRIDCPFALRLIDSQPMQRLRKIRQLGVAWLVYPGAEHSRFAHSLGVFHLSQLLIESINRNSGKSIFTPTQTVIVGLAALSHDLGHGAFSHLFEGIARAELGVKAVKHEDWTLRVLKEHDQVSSILEDAEKALGIDAIGSISAILTHTHKPHYVGEVISSQLDVDRFDYLLRDSLMTGTRYGAFDLAWFLRTLQVASVNTGQEAMDVLAVEGKRGFSAIETYLLGRHYMYRHVYYHKTIRAAEAMLKSILRRAVWLVRNAKLDSPHPVISAFASNASPGLSDYLNLDDFRVLTWVEDWANSAEDKVLKDLCQRFRARAIFGTIDAPIDNVQFRDESIRLRGLVEANGFDKEYYLSEDKAEDVAYKDYFYDLERGKEDEHQEIYWTDKHGVARSLSGSEGVVMLAKKALRFGEIRWYVPKEIVDKYKSTAKV